MVSAIKVQDLRVHHGERLVLDGVRLEARFGNVLALLGPNGAGKSTLLKAMVGLVHSEGEIHLNGTPLINLNSRERARSIAYVPQRSELNVPLSVYSVVGQGRYAHARATTPGSIRDAQMIESALEQTNVSTLRARRFTELSYGERQRVLIARALATGSRILLLDEPSASLDIGHALQLHALLRRLAKDGYCVVLAIHGLADAATWTDEAALLESGKLLVHGKSRDVIAPGRIETVYGVQLLPRGALGFRLAHPEPSAQASS